MARPRKIETTKPKDNGDFLVILEGDRGLKGEVRNIKNPKEVRMFAWFYYEDKDASEYRVKEYFNFPI